MIAITGAGWSEFWVGAIAGAGVALSALASLHVDCDLERVLGAAVLDSLNSAHLTVKDASSLMGVDEANLRSMLRGEGRYHLGLVHLARLPFGFWQWFGPTLFALLVKRNLASMAEDLGLRKSA